MDKSYQERTQSAELREPREKIVEAIREKLKKDEKSVRTLSTEIGFKHAQVFRVLRGYNCSLDTLLTILNGLDLEIVVKPKKKNIHKTKAELQEESP